MEEQVDKAQPINQTPNEPPASQTTLIGQGNHEVTMGQSPVRARRLHSNQQMIPTEEGAVHNEPEESREQIGSMEMVEPQLPIPPTTPITTYQGKRKRGQKTQVPTDDAPYRNTRTRSGSVAHPPSAVPRPVRRGRKKKAIEASAEESANQGRAEPAVVPETSAEEAEQLLMAETNGEGSGTPNSNGQQERAWSAMQILQTLRMKAEGRSPRHPSSPSNSQRSNDVSDEAEGQGRTDLTTPSGRSPQRLQWSATRLSQSYPRESEVEEKPLVRRRTMETDDEQIDRKLRQTKPEYDDLDPAKLLREFNESKPHVSPTPMGSEGSQTQRPSLLPVVKQDEEKRKPEEDYVPPTITRAARYARRQR